MDFFDPKTLEKSLHSLAPSWGHRRTGGRRPVVGESTEVEDQVPGGGPGRLRSCDRVGGVDKPRSKAVATCPSTCDLALAAKTHRPPRSKNGGLPAAAAYGRRSNCRSNTFSADVRTCTWPLLPEASRSCSVMEAKAGHGWKIAPRRTQGRNWSPSAGWGLHRASRRMTRTG